MVSRPYSRIAIEMNWFFVLLMLFSTQVCATCWDDASREYKVSSDLLRAIASVESGFNNKAINRANDNGSRDVCMMQINSSWFPILRREGITEQSLLDDPCQCVKVGARVLSENFSRLGVNWRAVGAYNASSEHKRNAYAWKVYAALNGKDLRAKGARTSANSPTVARVKNPVRVEYSSQRSVIRFEEDAS